MLKLIGPHMVIQPVDRDTGFHAPRLQFHLHLTLEYIANYCSGLGWDFEIVKVVR